ncbi:hypothetical protein [Nocardioides sp.]|uniref:hypothetical protein n=1 Tax=Nocardioides sp. TaxID=35761 RepID=UPI00261BA5A6|nr:hypothetical protein [Nocardioides sp.]
MPQDPRLAAAAAQAREQSAAAVSSLRAMTAEIRREQSAFRREREQRSSDRAEQARNGELGPEMQQVQRRVDAGATTWDDVLQGRDDHPSAGRVRENVQRNLTTLGEQLRADPEFVEADEAAQETEERIRRESR